MEVVIGGVVGGSVLDATLHILLSLLSQINKNKN